MLADWPFIKEHIHSGRDESEHNSAWGDFRGPFGYGLCFFVPDVDVHQYIQHSEIHFKEEIETDQHIRTYRDSQEYRMAEIIAEGENIKPMFAWLYGAHTGIFEAKFTNAFMAHENFEHSTILASNFSDAVLDSSNFRHTQMVRNDFSKASLKSANLNYINLDTRHHISPTFSLGEINDAHSFADTSPLETGPYGGALLDLNFQNANLTGASFENSYIPGSNFQGADLTDTNFVMAFLCDSNFSNTTLDGQSFRNSDYGPFEFGIDNTGLRGVCFDNSTLTGFSFSGVDLSGTSFKEAHIRGADFSEAVSLQDANFSGAFLDGVTFHWETLKTATWFGENSMKKRGDIRIFIDRDVEEILEEAAQLGVRNLEGLRSLLIFNPREEGTDLTLG